MSLIQNSFNINLQLANQNLERGRGKELLVEKEINLGDSCIIIDSINHTERKSEWGFYLLLNDAGTLVKRIPVAHIKKAFDMPAFTAIYTNRCIIPILSFSITKKENGEAVKYVVSREDEKMFWIAGIWEAIVRNGETKNTFLCITHDSEEKLLPYIKNTPLILDQDFAYTWLNKDIPARQIPDLIHPVEDYLLHVTKV